MSYQPIKTCCLTCPRLGSEDCRFFKGVSYPKTEDKPYNRVECDYYCERHRYMSLERNCQLVLFLTQLYESIPKWRHDLWNQPQMDMYNHVLGLYSTYFYDITGTSLPKENVLAIWDVEEGKVEPSINGSNVLSEWLFEGDFNSRLGLLCEWIVNMKIILEQHRFNYIRNTWEE